MAAALIPLLGMEPLGRAPIQSLPSEADTIRLIWGHVDSNFKGFRGISSICCNVEDRRGICLLGKPGSCGGQDSPCLLFKVKERWVEAGFPIVDIDNKIIYKLTNLKKKFDKKKGDRKLNQEEKVEFNQQLAKTTFSLAPVDWKQRIMADSFLLSATKKDRVRVLLDYVGDEESPATR